MKEATPEYGCGRKGEEDTARDEALRLRCKRVCINILYNTSLLFFARRYGVWTTRDHRPQTQTPQTYAAAGATLHSSPDAKIGPAPVETRGVFPQAASCMLLGRMRDAMDHQGFEFVSRPYPGFAGRRVDVAGRPALYWATQQQPALPVSCNYHSP